MTKISAPLFKMGLLTTVVSFGFILAACTPDDALPDSAEASISEAAENASDEAAPTAKPDYSQFTGEDKTIDIDGVAREYRVHLPPSYDATSKAPVVIAMHGMTSNKNWFQIMSNMDVHSDAQGMVTVYPQGLERKLFGNSQSVTHWNASFGSDVDDISFISQLIDTVIADYNLDADRVYITGHSNGGFMTYELMCSIPEKIAAAAPHAALMSNASKQDCAQKHNIPLLHIHGTGDGAVPYKGRFGFNTSVPDTLKFFADRYNCDAEKVSKDLPDLDVNDGATVSYETYENCQSGGAIEHYVIHEGGHTWSGSEIVNDTPHSMDIDTSKLIIDFFNGKSRPS